jgi:hypothetical protein
MVGIEITIFPVTVHGLREAREKNKNGEREPVLLHALESDHMSEHHTALDWADACCN